MYGILWWWFGRVNRRRAAGLEDEKMHNKSDDEIAELGDESPRFVYTT